MITAIATPLSNSIKLEIIYPDRKSHDFAEVKDTGEQLRLVYFHTRRFITDKMISWLKQRLYAGQEAGQQRITIPAAKLIGLLSFHRDVSLKQLCVLITQNAEAIESVAPNERSRFYKHYCQVIQPIIDYCKNFKEEEI